MDTSFDRKSGKDEWITPPYIINSLGEFDLDPCSSIDNFYNTAKNHYTKEDDGLSQDWYGRVYCNPPYGQKAKQWLRACSEHKNCIALTFARTETKMFFENVWYDAVGILFLKGRVKFYDIEGNRGNSSGAPSVLIAYDEYNADILRGCDLEGKFIYL